MFESPLSLCVGGCRLLPTPQRTEFFFRRVCGMLFLVVPPALVCRVEASAATCEAGSFDRACTLFVLQLLSVLGEQPSRGISPPPHTLTKHTRTHPHTRKKRVAKTGIAKNGVGSKDKLSLDKASRRRRQGIMPMYTFPTHDGRKSNAVVGHAERDGPRQRERESCRAGVGYLESASMPQSQ